MCTLFRNNFFYTKGHLFIKGSVKLMLFRNSSKNCCKLNWNTLQHCFDISLILSHVSFSLAFFYNDKTTWLKQQVVVLTAASTHIYSQPSKQLKHLRPLFSKSI